jgi:hypothetical protein
VILYPAQKHPSGPLTPRSGQLSGRFEMHVSSSNYFNYNEFNRFETINPECLFIMLSDLMVNGASPHYFRILLPHNYDVMVPQWEIFKIAFKVKNLFSRGMNEYLLLNT